MKTNKILISIIGIFCIFTSSIQAKDSYYYYNRNRISLKLYEDSVTVYHTIKGTDGQLVYASQNLSSQDQRSSLADTTITSVEYIIMETKNRLVKMSNRFYVQLFNPIEDIHHLQNIANKTHSIVLGPIPNMPDWYELMVHKSIINNSLELSNYFFETGLFREVDPGFIFNFAPSSACVTDTHFTTEQWGMPVINACDAWYITKGSADVKIAIIDDNIYTLHTEFASSQFVNAYNTTTHDTIPDQSYPYHGSMVCGIIASDHNHARIAGMAPDCKIMPISYTTTNQSVVAANLAEGISWAVNHGADVINCSWGDHNGQYQYLHSSILESAINNALTNGRNGKGCVVVFASGDQGANQVDYPAYVFSDILTIGAINKYNGCPYFSSYGASVDVVAPGQSIYSTIKSNYPGVEYYTDLGTSYSAPFVSGIAGLMLSVNPNLTQKEIADIIESTAQKVGSYSYTSHSGRPNGTWNDSVGYGLVDAYEAVLEALNRYYVIQGPDYICFSDTVCFQLQNAPANATFTWTATIPGEQYGSYNIVQGQGTSSICVTAILNEWPSIPLMDSGGNASEYTPMSPTPNFAGSISVTVAFSNSATYTFTKSMHSPRGNKPTFTSSSLSTWFTGTPRTFTVTNCSNEPDSSFVWEVKRGGNLAGTGTGRVFIFNPSLPGAYTISVTNGNIECEEQTTTQLYYVLKRKRMDAETDNNLLNITISEEDEGAQHSPAQLDEDSEYSLELWHSIYGLQKTKTAQSAREQMNISGLPQGLYILLLKENGNVIAETKVQIQ